MGFASKKTGGLTGWLKATEVYREHRVLAMAFLGFAAGLPFGLTGATLFVWLRREGIDISTIGLFSLLGAPYGLKFLWAPLLDRLPFPGLTERFGRRRGWLLVFQIGLILAIALLGTLDPASQIAWIAATGFAISCLSASQDIMIDAYRIEALEERQMAAGTALYVGGYRLGYVLVAGAAALYMADIVGWSGAYYAMAAMMLVGVVTVLSNPEPELPVTDDAAQTEREVEDFLRQRPHLRDRTATVIAWIYVSVVAPFAEFMKRPGWLTVLLFILLYKVGDQMVSIMTSTFLVDLEFTNREIANINKVYGFVAQMAGLVAGGVLLAKSRLIPSLWIVGILQLLSNLVFSVQALAGHDLVMLAVTVGFENFATGMGTVIFIAYLSSLCNIAYTATQYALLSSLMAETRVYLTSVSGYAVEWFGWFNYFLFTAAAALPGLFCLWLLARSMARETSRAG